MLSLVFSANGWGGAGGGDGGGEFPGYKTTTGTDPAYYGGLEKCASNCILETVCKTSSFLMGLDNTYIGVFSPIPAKGDNFRVFLFASLYTNSLLKRSLL